MKWIQWLAAGAAAAMLGACGGGSGAPVAEEAATVAVSGTVATGSPLAGATVSLLCADGGQASTATAGGDGKYKLALAETCRAPYLIRATGSGITLFAFADAAGNINVTPFTDLVARFATSNTPGTGYDAVAAGTRTVNQLWDAAKAADAKAKLLAKLASMGIPADGISDPLHAVFTAGPGDKLDDALEALKAARGAVPLASLVEQVLVSGGTPYDKPWNGWFAPGETALKYVATGCSWEPDAGPVLSNTSATVTLAASGALLAISLEVAGDTFTQPAMHAGRGNTFVSSGFLASLDILAVAASFRTEDDKKSATLQVQQEEVGSGPLRLSYWGDVGALDCGKVASGPKRSGMPYYDLSARVASIAAAATSTIAGSCESYGDGSPYDYSIGSLGEIRFNGQAMNATLLDPAAHPHAAYFEYLSFDYSGGTEHSVTLVFNEHFDGASLRLAGKPKRVVHQCGLST